MPSQTKKITKPKPKSRGGMPARSLPIPSRPRSLSIPSRPRSLPIPSRSPQRSMSSQSLRASLQRPSSPVSPSSNKNITLPTLGHYDIKKVKHISEPQRELLTNFEKEVYKRHIEKLNMINTYPRRQNDTNLFENLFETQMSYNSEIERKIHHYKSIYYITSKGYDLKNGRYLPQLP